MQLKTFLPLPTSTVSSMPRYDTPITPHSTLTKPSSEAPLNPLPRWEQLLEKNRQTPLTVGIEAKGLSVALVQKALQAWETATNHRIRFNLLENRSLAALKSVDILIVWAEAPLQQADHETAYSTGKAWLHVKVVNHQPLIIGSTIELEQAPLIDAYISTPQQAARLYTTILHEVGHALGLKHALKPASVMHPKGWKNTQLTPEDTGLFFQLYGTA
jgi:hypothetical protein